EVTAIRGKIVAYWRSLTVPFPEPGIRLIRRHEVDGFNRQMQDYRTELDDAVGRLDAHYAEMKEAARQRLGKLFNPNDYPPSLKGLFATDGVVQLGTVVLHL